MQEDAKVVTKKYSWGTMKTVHKGASYSIPLHPEHHEHIAKMKDGQVHDIKTEDGRQWHVKREGDTVHFHGANGGPKTSVKHSDLKEETHSELARAAASKYRSALARGDSVAASQANAERVRHKKAVELTRKKPHTPGDLDEEIQLDEVAPVDLDKYFAGVESKVAEKKPAKKEPEQAITGSQIKFFNNKIKEEVEVNEAKDTVVRDKTGKLISFKHEGDWKKADPKKNPEGKVHNLAGQALKKAQNLNKEEVELEEGYVVRYHNPKSEKHGSEKHFDSQESAQKHADRGNSVDKIGGKYSVHKTNEKGHDVNEQAPVAPTIDRKYIKGTPEWKAHKEKSKPINGHPTNMKKEEISIDDEGNLVVENKLSYGEFMSQLLEYTPGAGGVTRVQGRSYGAQYHDPEGDDDADDKPVKKVDQPKRGRGRPSGSKSGANVKRLSSKGTSDHGYDSTGYKLHLPNSNK